MIIHLSRILTRFNTNSTVLTEPQSNCLFLCFLFLSVKNGQLFITGRIKGK